MQGHHLVHVSYRSQIERMAPLFQQLEELRQHHDLIVDWRHTHRQQAIPQPFLY
jgi:hypothetical protein